jgi:hypothetical protein
MIDLIKNNEIKRLVKTISSNLIGAQREEKRDLNFRNKYLEAAGSDSILLGSLLLDFDKVESSKYFLSAGRSFEESGAIDRSKTCYEKVIEIGVDDIIDKAREGLKRLERLNQRIDLDLNTKEGRLLGLDYIVWKYKGLNTLEAFEYLKRDFGLELSTGTIRSYARELEARNRVAIWGGPQGRIYHIYPNLANLATRKGYYGIETAISGSIEERITPSFRIQFQNWSYNKEIFVVNGTKFPKVLMTVDMNAYIKNLDKLSKKGYAIKAVGTFQEVQSLKSNGYEIIQSPYQDFFDSRILIDRITGKQIYNRNISGAS